VSSGIRFAFSVSNRSIEFSSASKSVIINGTDQPSTDGFILKEDGFRLLFEDGTAIRRE
jgi:hypothetical protein